VNEPRDLRPESPESAPPPGAAAMNVLRRVLLIGLAVLALGSGVAWWMSRSSGGGVAVASTYYCPMHPSYTSDRRGECPICGMNLEPAPVSDTTRGGGDVPGLSVVEIGPERLQLIGVRTAIVEQTPLGSQTPLVAFVVADESRVRRVQLRVAGWVQTMNVTRTGDTVREGEPLLTIYSPELYQSELEFLISLGAADDSARVHGPLAQPRKASRDVGELVAGRERLRLLGVHDSEIARLERELRAVSQLALPSPVTGTVLERHVTEGDFVAADMPLLTVADLSRVRVVADLYEMDLGRVRVGDRAVFTSDGLPGRRFESRIEFVSPVVSAETRTAQAWIELASPDGALRPGMYGRLQVLGRSAMVLSVPSDAVIRTGTDEYVFLARAGGRFEPRRVGTGVREGERTEIRQGLAVGDTVVAGASFLIDSESRLKAALSGMSAPAGGSQP
jgi:membrane fusion protein, copper/silver efflux system